MLLKIIFICWIFWLQQLTWTFAGYGVGKNLTDFMRHRDKRGLVFNGGGSTKLVIGPVYPFELDDPVGWRSLLCLYNIHVGSYNIPSTPLYAWDKWENLYARSNRARKILQPDESREFFYLILENFMNTKHGHGRECLLRAICENVQIQQHMDFFAEILNVILTPGRGDVQAIYGHAHEMGRARVDCLHYYSKCPLGLSFLDELLQHDSYF